MPPEPSDELGTAADSSKEAEERPEVRLGLVAAGLLVPLALFWLLSGYRAWAAPLGAACAAALWSVMLFRRRGQWPRTKGIVASLFVAGLLVGFVFASGGWAYTFGAGTGLILTLEAPAEPILSASVFNTTLTLNYSFANTGSDRLRFDPGSGFPTRPPLLHLYDSNGTLMDPPIPGDFWRHGPPGHFQDNKRLGGYAESYVELGPGGSWSGRASWPLAISSNSPPLPAGNYTAHLSWKETDCSYSWLPCFVGDLTSNDVVVQFA